MKEHAMPVGTLVEIVYESEYDEPQDQVKGVRLFVVNHSYDCDGTPLYDLSFDKTAYTEWRKFDIEVSRCRSKPGDVEVLLANLLRSQSAGKILRHYSADALLVVENK